jgi:phosphoglycerate dehydrogenase-like enzyme
MKKGIIGAAALDVLWDEGTGQPEELMRMKNLVVTPHLGGSTFECDMVLVEGVSKGV